MPKNNLFRMQVQDTFEIGDEGLVRHGLVVSGRVDEGTVSVGDKVTIISNNSDRRIVVVNHIEMVGNLTDTATQGDDVGLLFTDLSQGDVSQGDIIQSE